MELLGWLSMMILSSDKNYSSCLDIYLTRSKLDTQSNGAKMDLWSDLNPFRRQRPSMTPTPPSPPSIRLFSYVSKESKCLNR